MTIPDGAEYWWDVKGYGKCDGARRGKRDMSPEAVARRKTEKAVRNSTRCQLCDHPLGSHGRCRVAPGKRGKRRHGGQCNTCPCAQFIAPAEMQKTYPPVHPVVFELLNPSHQKK